MFARPPISPLTDTPCPYTPFFRSLTARCRADGLAISFGCIRAVDGVSFDVARGEVFTIIGPNGAGKTTVFNLISRIYDPTEGRLLFDGADITALAPHKIAGLGIARTFQNIELFEHATVLHNLLIGRHARRGGNLLADMLFLPSRSEEHTSEL